VQRDIETIDSDMFLRRQKTTHLSVRWIVVVSDPFLHSRIAQLAKWDAITNVELIESAEHAAVPTLLLPIEPYKIARYKTSYFPSFRRRRSRFFRPGYLKRTGLLAQAGLVVRL
jgi:hypothetical protein